jgi:hypothetical protein
VTEKTDMLFLKTIRFDNSDLHVFDNAAEPGEWAVSGAFAFADLPETMVTGKIKQAFAHGMLGTDSFGWSTLACIAEIDESSYETVIGRIANHFVAAYGAPDHDAALPLARQEVEFAAGLCEHPVNTLLAVQRSFNDDGIVERFRIVRPPSPEMHANIWEIVED